jgi:hypothetical protein
MTSDDEGEVRGSVAGELERLLFGLGVRYLLVPDEVGVRREAVVAVIGAHFGSGVEQSVATEGLAWQQDPPLLRVVRVARIGTMNDRAEIVHRVARSGRPRVWLAQRVSPWIAILATVASIYQLAMIAVAVAEEDAHLMVLWAGFWFAWRGLIEITRRADSHRLRRLLDAVSASRSTQSAGQESCPAWVAARTRAEDLGTLHGSEANRSHRREVLMVLGFSALTSVPVLAGLDWLSQRGMIGLIGAFLAFGVIGIAGVVVLRHVR